MHREYKYFIVQRGDLDVAAMQAAAAHFVGYHDFRNFCKVDAQHVSNFRRTVLDFRIAPAAAHGGGGGASGGMQVYALHVRGTAFLWHQVWIHRPWLCWFNAWCSWLKTSVWY